MRRSISAICVVLLLDVISTYVAAQAPPSDDAYVTSTQPLVNFGRSGILPVQSGTVSYIRMNLGAFPSGGSVSKATLRLYVNAVVAPGSFDIYQVAEPWNERSLSHRNAPSLGTSATGGTPISVSALSLNKFLLVDITPLVQGWLSGSIPNHGIALALTSVSGSFSFDSKESTGTGHQPEIEVSFGVAAQTPTVDSVAYGDLSQASAVGNGVDSDSAPSVIAQQTGTRSAQGHGTKGYLPLWLNALYLGNSILFQDVNKNVGLGTSTPLAAFDVTGNINVSGNYQIGGKSVLVATPLIVNSGGMFSWD